MAAYARQAKDSVVAEYLIDFNGTRAYRAAFPDVTPDSARVLACRLLAKVHIQEAIAAAAKRTAA